MKHLFFVALLLSLGSCNKNYINVEIADVTPPSDTSTTVNTKYLVQFTPSVMSLVGSQSPTITPIGVGRYVSLYAYSKGELVAEVNYVSQTAGSLTPFGSRGMYLTTGSYMFYGVSTNQEGNFTPSFVDNISESVTNGVDYLYWNSGFLQTITSNRDLPMNLAHAASQVVVKFVSEPSGLISSLNGAAITASDTTTSKWNLFTGAITPAVKLASTPMSMGVTGNYAQATMIPLINTDTLTMTFNVNIAGESVARNYQARLGLSGKELLPGHSYLFTVLLSENGVTPAQVNIINWVDVVDGNPIIPGQL